VCPIRQCKECGLVKSIDLFKSRDRGKKCKKCITDKDRARVAAWVAANKDRHLAVTRQYKSNRSIQNPNWRKDTTKAQLDKEWMIEIKSNPCADCGGRFQTCSMDFDHRDGCTKEYNIGTMFAHHYSRTLIEKELEKCDLVCANCHRVRTRDRITGKRRGKASEEKCK